MPASSSSSAAGLRDIAATRAVGIAGDRSAGAVLIALIAGALIADDVALIVCRRRAWARALVPVAFAAFISEIATLAVAARRRGYGPAAASVGVAAVVSVLALAVVVRAQTALTRTQHTGHEPDAEPRWWATFERELADYVERGRRR